MLHEVNLPMHQTSFDAENEFQLFSTTSLFGSSLAPLGLSFEPLGNTCRR